MKKTAALSLLLALLLCLSACGLQDALFDFGIFGGGTTPASTPGIELEDGPSDSGPAVEYTEDDRSYGYYYDQLSDNAKSVYRTIYADSLNREGIAIAFKDAVTASGAEEEADALKKELQASIMSLVQPALDALIFDHPQIFWISMGGSTFSIPMHQTKEEGALSLSVSSLVFNLAFQEGLEETDILRLRAALDEAVVTYPEKTASRYETLAIMHKKLCEGIVYEKNAPHAHDVIGGLVDGLAVCDGYARAFKLLCDAYEIPCVVVVGDAIQNGQTDPHAWNYVEMEDGKWYAVDVTWNDSESTPTQHYFLVGADTLQASLSVGSFAHSHRPDGMFSAGNYSPFSFPALERTRYSPTLLNNE